MVPEPEKLLSLSHPLATPEQLSSSLDGIPPTLESSVRFAGARLTQAAGILLRLPQETIAQAIVTFLRFYAGSEGGSFRVTAAKDLSAASLYMTAKISAFPQTTRSVLNVYAYLTAHPQTVSQPLTSSPAPTAKPDPETYILSEGDYHPARTVLLQTEMILLRTLSFNTNVVLPHRFALTYLQTLGVLPSPPTAQSKSLAVRVLAHLNTALLSPQVLYLTHQPTTLAVAAIYLAAREVGVKLPECTWWEVFDVDREDLGFLVVGFLSCEGWVADEKKKWTNKNCPLTVEELELEMNIDTE